MDELMLKIENVKKEYKLGQIGGTTLRDELQRLWAKVRKKEDPTKKIGAKNYNQGETFMALNGVSFEVKKGERIGIIGHNGAGKSTLLKLISRITAPSEGAIYLNGRVASMLEVGTGFHGELTGRENVYMNGAILGMTKKEIDSKMEDIIDFSEVRQFIDTPVKRYSSGMYVKLAFSVAAHLDSEIMIMDEVLAVGDMAFQKKCLDKMNQVSQDYGRTILYVSHNMNTIRELCNRVVVLNRGKLVFDGAVEEGIDVYTNNLNNYETDLPVFFDCTKTIRPHEIFGNAAFIDEFEFLDVNSPVYKEGTKFRFRLKWHALDTIEKVRVRFSVKKMDGTNIGLAEMKSQYTDAEKGQTYDQIYEFDLSNLTENLYFFNVYLYTVNQANNIMDIDVLFKVYFKVVADIENNTLWLGRFWGNIRLNEIKLIN